jgi:multidrug efflux pump subunit AcrA (membrane-fusion protein)
MAHSSTIRPPLWLLPLLLVGLFSACSPDAVHTAAPTKESRDVSVVRASLQPMESTITALGSLEAIDHATISIKTTGRLRSLAVDVGSRVRAGDVLAEIEPRDYELRVQQSAAALAQIRARLGLQAEGDDDSAKLDTVPSVRAARAVLDEARNTLERVRRLQAEKISSQADFDSASANFAVAQTRYETAQQDARELQALLAQRRAEFEIAQQQLSDTRLRAPFDGVVQERRASLGEFLASGSPVVSLVRIDPLRLRIEVPERDAAKVRPGQTVRIRLEGTTNLLEAPLLRTSPALDSRTRMLMVEADFPNPGTLRAGSLARSEIVVAPSVPTLVVPADTLVVFAGIEKVFVVSTNHTALEMRVETGRRNGGWIEILEGLKSGTSVIRDPAGLQTGDPVNPRIDDTSMPAANPHAKAG